jgi:murein DD-endopeptidase MepM/ murein hydrolase activator NlpD
MKYGISVTLLAVLVFSGWTSRSSDRFSEQGIIPESPTVPTASSSISIFPDTIFPGDPIMVSVISSLKPESILFNNKNVPIFSHDNKYGAFVPIDFNEKVLDHEVRVLFQDGTFIIKSLKITPREKIERPLGIPEKLGGNTPAAAQNLINNLAQENAVINSVPTEQQQLWKNSFSFPLKSIFVTDDYGYDRKTVNSTIVHKGTDFRAPEGVEVFAMSDGVVRLARQFTVYGNSIVIDHGHGVQSLYMHLSQMDIKEGDVVRAGQIIGLSGKTGYAEAPHLHISIKIDRISIDPMTFLAFFNVI